jgi:iron complex outermembrane receptor protein
LGIRATGSNGFRAPTLAEAFYTSTNVAPSSAQVQVQPDSAAAHLLGLGNLQAEKSVNLSLGLVWHPLAQVMATLDVYQISITNRITGTGALYGLINKEPQEYSNLVNNVITASGQSIDTAGAIQTTSIQLFANGIDTRTRGADFTLKVPQELNLGHIDYTVSASYSKTELTNTPPVLPGAPDAALYDPIAISEITSASPLYVINLGATWTYEKLSINVLEKLYGPSKAYENADADLSMDVIDSIGFTPITNINVSYQLHKNVRADVGALNVFNRYPPRINALAYNTMYNLGDYTSVSQYPSFSPFGIDGGFYYAKLTFSF